jgi:hypothetical protein
MANLLWNFIDPQGMRSHQFRIVGVANNCLGRDDQTPVAISQLNESLCSLEDAATAKMPFIEDNKAREEASLYHDDPRCNGPLWRRSAGHWGEVVESKSFRILQAQRSMKDSDTKTTDAKDCIHPGKQSLESGFICNICGLQRVDVCQVAAFGTCLLMILVYS